MKRRTFALAAAAAVMPASFLAALPAHAQGTPAPKGYKAIMPAAPTDAPAGKIDVIEFFQYGCIHCMHFEPVFEKWKQSVPKDVAVRRVHVAFSKEFEPLQRIYFALVALNAPDAIHAKVFAAVQIERLSLDQPAVLFPWIAQQGIDRAKFEQAYNSFGVANQIQRADLLQDAYKVEGTPALGIAGRFYTDPTYAKASAADSDAFAAMTQVADSLIARIRKGA
jgi:thiol:disulfide interchange protein DsbA